MGRGLWMFFVVLGLMCNLYSVNASLGISQSIIEINFLEGGTQQIDYNVHTDNPNQKILIYSKDELSKYVTFDKTSFVGSGSFRATIKFPDSMSPPGIHNLYIYAAEDISSRASEGTIGTSLIVGALVIIFVPYPGRYIDAGLGIPSVNVGDAIPVELNVVNRGTENLTVTPEIIFYSSLGKEVNRISFDSSEINRGEMDNFIRELNSEGMGPDVYTAKAIIDYNGDIKEINTTFKVGNLNVDIVNFTKSVTAGEVSPFAVRVKSNWNGNIDGIFADVKIWLNESESVTFRTPSGNLAPWEEKNIDGYLDTEGLKPGKYEMDVTINYAGQTSYVSGELTVLKGKIDKIWFVLGGGLLLALLLSIAIAYMLFRNRKK